MSTSSPAPRSTAGPGSAGIEARLRPLSPPVDTSFCPDSRSAVSGLSYEAPAALVQRLLGRWSTGGDEKMMRAVEAKPRALATETSPFPRSRDAGCVHGSTIRAGIRTLEIDICPQTLSLWMGVSRYSHVTDAHRLLQEHLRWQRRR
jgi:hypothetical protein